MTMYQSWRDVPKDKWRWKNFSPREMACKGTGSLLLDEVAMDKLQQLRDALGVPLIVVSAYRSPEHNRAVGGAKNSYHMKGVAFDIQMANHDPMLFEVAAREIGFRGFGYYPKQGFMHIDLGPARKWGTEFTRSSATRLPEETPRKEKLSQSTTLRAVAAGGAAAAAQTAAIVQSLEGNAQLVALALAGVIILSLLWIARERIRKWLEGIQ